MRCPRQSPDACRQAPVWKAALERLLRVDASWDDNAARGTALGRRAQPRGIHLCGDATRHFVTLRDELNVQSFDTGFPVDFGKLRRELGPDVEIMGGPPVADLLHGTPESVYEKSKQILLSGIKEGGRFILREGNNLPPCTPVENLEAMYRACLDYGTY